MSSFVKHASLATLVIAGICISAVHSDGIYGEDAKPVGLTEDSAQIIVGLLTIAIFVLMALEWFTPEVLLLSSLIIVLLLEILTLPQALSGNMQLTVGLTCNTSPNEVLDQLLQVFQTSR